MVRVDKGGNARSEYPDTPLSVLHPLIFVMIPTDKREAVTSLWQLDQNLSQQIRSVREPALRVMRLLWWQEQLSAVAAGGTAPAHPLIQALATTLDRQTLERLVRLPEIWSDFVESEPLALTHIDTFAQERGSMLFSETAKLLGNHSEDAPRLHTVARYWGIADTAAHLSDPGLRSAAFDLLNSPAPQYRDAPRALAGLYVLATARSRNRGAIKPLAEQMRLLRFSLIGT